MARKYSDLRFRMSPESRERSRHKSQEAEESTWKLTEDQSAALSQVLDNPALPPNEKLRAAYRRALGRKREADGCDYTPEPA